MAKSKYKKEKKLTQKEYTGSFKNEKTKKPQKQMKKITSKYNKEVIKYNISKIYETIIFTNDNTFKLNNCSRQYFNIFTKYS